MQYIPTKNAVHFRLILYCKPCRSIMSRNISVSTFFYNQIMSTDSRFAKMIYKIYKLCYLLNVHVF